VCACRYRREAPKNRIEFDPYAGANRWSYDLQEDAARRKGRAVERELRQVAESGLW
jgi:hypothetical protein